MSPGTRPQLAYLLSRLRAAKWQVASGTATWQSSIGTSLHGETARKISPGPGPIYALNSASLINDQSGLHSTALCHLSLVLSRTLSGQPRHDGVASRTAVESWQHCLRHSDHALQLRARTFSSGGESKVAITKALETILEAQMASIERRYAELCQVLLDELDASPDRMAAVNKELSSLEAPMSLVRTFRSKVKEIEELERMVADSEEEADLVRMAEEELGAAREEKEGIQLEVLFMLLPRDEAERRGCILEVRAGSGGDEASLFAMEVFRMYERYAGRCGWKFEVVSVAESDLRGYKEASATISGEGVYGRLQFESGVHRVQRVPVTEKSGRVHTSAASVVVLPQADEVDVQIRNEDLRIDTYRAGGAGGQSVNTTSSAVRVTHVPSGIVVAIQDERSQHMNKAKALKVLRAKLYDIERQRLQLSRSQQRSEQIGSGDRSERIRTYNFPQGRVTDHRVNLTLHALEQVLMGEELDALVDALKAKREMDLIAALEMT